jgi:hypothetical protein
MRTASMAKYRPKLEGIFGPLSKSEDEYLRRVLDQADNELSRIANHIGYTVGMEMMWAESGQLFIGGHVVAGDGAASAVDELLNSTRRLASLALDSPIEYWLSKAKS